MSAGIFERAIGDVIKHFDLSVPEERARAFHQAALMVATVPDDASRLAWVGWASLPGHRPGIGVNPGHVRRSRDIRGAVSSHADCLRRTDPPTAGPARSGRPVAEVSPVFFEVDRCPRASSGIFLSDADPQPGFRREMPVLVQKEGE